MRIFKSVIFCCICLFVMGCTPSVPSEYIQPDEMENILYDYHLADGMYTTSNSAQQSTMQEYKTAILKKYGVTEAQFEASLQYYLRHTKRLHDIYENISERLSREAVAQGASTSDLSKYGTLSATGDTANVWTNDRAFALSTYKPFNANSFAVKVDTAFHAGDKLMLNFNCDFIFQDGMRDGVAVLAVKFANDSTASQVLHMSSNSSYSMQIVDSKHLGIKEVKGYFMLNPSIDPSQSKTTIKMMVVSDVQLVRMHEQKVDAALKPDSTKVDSVRNNNEGNKGDTARKQTIPPQGGRVVGAQKLQLKSGPVVVQ